MNNIPALELYEELQPVGNINLSVIEVTANEEIPATT